jgi:putative PIN family toxin of toxin-antitoxin system
MPKVPRAVFDSTVLVSAFLTPNGVSDELLRHGRRGAFTLSLSHQILEETRRVLLEYEHIRRRYPYSDQDVEDFISTLRGGTQLISASPPAEQITRDSNDDMVIACALAARSPYLVTRDKDLLTLKTYQGVTILTPEEFIRILRQTLPSRQR